MLLLWAFTLVLTNVITISSQAGLENINNCLSCNYFLTQNIVLTAPFAPIGSFNGTLNGNGYSITNLTFTNLSSPNVGLFTVLNGAEIVNLNVSGQINLTLSALGAVVNIGILAGSINNTKLYQVFTAGTLLVVGNASDLSVGSFAGAINQLGPLADLESSAAVIVEANVANALNVGGLFGYVYGSPVISHLTASQNSSVTVLSNIGAQYSVGGIAGFSNAYGQGLVSYGTVIVELGPNGTNVAYVGGLIGSGPGMLSGHYYGPLVSLNATGPQLSAWVGGIAGYLIGYKSSYSLYVSNLTSFVSCISAGSCIAGGIIGETQDTLVSASVSFAAVSCTAWGFTYCGGIIGKTNVGITYCYVNTTTIIAIGTANYSQIVAGGLIATVNTETQSGVPAVFKNSVVLANTVLASGAGYPIAGGYLGIYKAFSTGGAVISFSAVYADMVVAKETGTPYPGQVAVAGGFVGISFSVSYYANFININGIGALSTNNSAIAGGFSGALFSTLFSVCFAQASLVLTNVSAGSVNTSAYGGGFAGYINQTDLSEYSAAFVGNVIGVQVNGTISVGGFAGTVMNNNVTGIFVQIGLINVTTQSLSDVFAGGLLGTLQGTYAGNMAGCWASATINVTYVGPQQGQACLARLGGAIGGLSGGRAIAGLYANGSITLNGCVSQWCGQGVGIVGNAYIFACIGNMNIQCGIPNNSTYIGGVVGSLSCNNTFYNNQATNAAPVFNSSLYTNFTGNMTSATLAQLQSNLTYQNLGGFNFSSGPSAWGKTTGAIPGIWRLPNLQQPGQTCTLMGSYCVYTQFSNINISSSLNGGYPFLIPSAAAWVCPPYGSLCNGTYVSPTNISCAAGWAGAFCNLCTGNSSCNSVSPTSYCNMTSQQCVCAPTFMGMGCTRSRCHGGCGTTGTCVAVNPSSNMYQCKCNSPQYYIQNQLCVFGCPNLTAGACTGPMEPNFRNVYCSSPNAQPTSNCGSGYTNSSANLVAASAILGVIAALVIIALIAVILVMHNKYVGSIRKRTSYAVMEPTSQPASQ